MNIEERIAKTYLVPVVVLEDSANAVNTANAMLAGGVDIMEITLRTKAGIDSINQVSKNCPDTLVGAGTVITLDQCKAAIDAGARFIVSPGYNGEIVRHCIDQKINVFPGCVTPTEIMQAVNDGLHIIKFFPANVYGGIGAMKALRGPFPQIKFIPTGGVSLSNLAEYISPMILAIGGGWLCPTKEIDAHNFAAITEICKQSVKVIKEN